ncbi:MAG: hypothetical protein ABJC24_02670 [Chloroflexota bacterium]
MDNESAERWEIDQDELGNPLMRHRHTKISIGAPVTKDADGRRIARCPDCGEQIGVRS